MKKLLPTLAGIALISGCGASDPSDQGAPGERAGSPLLAAPALEVTSATAWDHSARLRDIPSAERVAAEAPDRPLRLIGAQVAGVDAALQTAAGPLVAATFGLSFAGV